MHGNVCHRGTAIPCCGSMHCNDELPHNPDAVGWPGICRGEGKYKIYVLKYNICRNTPRVFSNINHME